MKKFSTILIGGIAVFLLSLIYTGYAYFSGQSAIKNDRLIDQATLEYEDKLVQYEAKNIEQAVAAKGVLDNLKSDIRRWSEIIQKIRETLPKDASGDDLIEVLSYSGSGDNLISMSVKTVSLRSEPYFDVATLIEAFDESPDFADSFVPAVSGGTSQIGDEVLTFTFNTRYVGEGGVPAFVSAPREEEDLVIDEEPVDAEVFVEESSEPEITESELTEPEFEDASDSAVSR